MNSKIKDYLISASVSFLGGALSSLVIFFDNATGWSDLSWKVVLSAVLFSAVRTTVRYFSRLVPKAE